MAIQYIPTFGETNLSGAYVVMMREPIIPSWSRASSGAPAAQNRKTMPRAHRAQAVFPFRAKPSSRFYSVPGFRAPLNTKNFPRPSIAKWPLPMRKTWRLAKPTTNSKSEYEASPPETEGRPPRTQKREETPHRVSFRQKGNLYGVKRVWRKSARNQK